MASSISFTLISREKYNGDIQFLKIDKEIKLSIQPNYEIEASIICCLFSGYRVIVTSEKHSKTELEDIIKLIRGIFGINLTIKYI